MTGAARPRGPTGSTRPAGRRAPRRRPARPASCPANGVGPIPPSSTTRMPASGPGARGTERHVGGHPALGHAAVPGPPGSRRPCRRPAGWPARRAPGTPWPRARRRPPWPPASPRVGRPAAGRGSRRRSPCGTTPAAPGGPVRRSTLGVPQQGERVRCGLAEVEGGVDEHPVGRDAGRHRPLGAFAAGCAGRRRALRAAPAGTSRRRGRCVVAGPRCATRRSPRRTARRRARGRGRGRPRCR